MTPLRLERGFWSRTRDGLCCEFVVRSGDSPRAIGRVILTDAIGGRYPVVDGESGEVLRSVEVPGTRRAVIVDTEGETCFAGYLPVPDAGPDIASAEAMARALAIRHLARGTGR